MKTIILVHYFLWILFSFFLKYSLEPLIIIPQSDEKKIIFT
jgi:hypothetical protein